jgi:hypothetical protein
MAFIGDLLVIEWDFLWEYHGIEWPLHGIYPVVIKQVAMGRNHC